MVKETSERLNCGCDPDHHADWLEIWLLLKKVRADFYEVFRIVLQSYDEQLIKFLRWSGSPC